MSSFTIGKRRVGPADPPLVVAEIGINHDGDVEKAIQMVDDAAVAGCECVKFQCHIPEAEMLYNDVVPANASESIWDMMVRCALTEAEERRIKEHVESKGLIYLCTPFSREAVERLETFGVEAYKVGSGECNNHPLLRYVASRGKPILLSTGMNDVASVEKSVTILRAAGVGFALLHCSSLYPAPPDTMRLGAIQELARCFPDAVIGLSDHSIDNYASFAAVALGARIIEKHFTSDRRWSGSDIPLSVDPAGLANLVHGVRVIDAALGGSKTVLREEESTMAFAFSSVVTTRAIVKGEKLTEDNIWVKRPGTGPLRASDYERVLRRVAKRDIPADVLLDGEDCIPPVHQRS